MMGKMLLYCTHYWSSTNTCICNHGSSFNCSHSRWVFGGISDIGVDVRIFLGDVFCNEWNGNRVARFVKFVVWQMFDDIWKSTGGICPSVELGLVALGGYGGHQSIMTRPTHDTNIFWLNHFINVLKNNIDFYFISHLKWYFRSCFLAWVSWGCFLIWRCKRLGICLHWWGKHLLGRRLHWRCKHLRKWWS